MAETPSYGDTMFDVESILVAPEREVSLIGETDSAFPSPPQIKLKCEDLEINPEERLMEELNLSSSEAESIKTMLWEKTKEKIEHSGKEWADEVKKAFFNHFITILIEEVKRVQLSSYGRETYITEETSTVSEDRIH